MPFRCKIENAYCLIAQESDIVKEVIKDFALFTDVSVSPGLRLGVGAYVMIPASFLESPPGVIRRPEITGQLQVKRFEDTSSTRLELQAVLWALTEIRQEPRGSLTIYSDSQCVSGLLKRKPRLLATGFLSKKTNRQLGNASLYRTFYELHDESGFHVVKVAGHSASRAHDTAHRIFSFVDKEARKALKIWLNELAEERAEKNSGPWCVYLLRCSNNSLYIGMTNDLEKRLEKHTLGTGSKFVRSWRPFELVKTIPCKDEGEARRLEYDLKKLPRKKKIEVLELRMGR
ncbi:MAG: GIY-YIG nuclease family protein [Nitrospirota bacterium]|nr:GIY-YIG nuclease family protein [Nitrospirota bacterium]